MTQGIATVCRPPSPVAAPRRGGERTAAVQRRRLGRQTVHMRPNDNRPAVNRAAS